MRLVTQAGKRRAKAEAEAAAREAAAKDRAQAAAREEPPAPAVEEPKVVDVDSSDAPTAPGTESLLQRRMAKAGMRGLAPRRGPKARPPPRRSRWSLDALLSNEHAAMAIAVVLILLMMLCVYAFWKHAQ